MSIKPMVPACHRQEISNTFALSEESFDKLKTIMYEHTFQSGTFIYFEGDVADKLYFVIKGHVQLFKTSDDGEDLELYQHTEGDLFGDISDATSKKYELTAKALSDCELGVIQQKDLESLIWQNGQLAVEFVRWLGYMHRSTQLRLRDLLFYGKQGALASTLIRMANTFGKEDHNHSIHIGEKFTNSNIAGMIGATRETVNRMIGKMKKDNILEMKNGYITIQHINSLKEICHCEECPINICRL